MQRSGLFWLLAVCLSVMGCSRDEGDVDVSRPSEFGFQTNLHTTLVEEGRVAYERYCIGCHGAQGDGNGASAGFFHPRPRNFVKANFKFSSTRSGQLPTDDDLRRTIRGGLKGSAMPPFELLPNPTVDALVEYIKTFSPKWTERAPASPIPRANDPYRNDPEAGIARGEVIYHGYAQCWNCHPAYVPAGKISQHLQVVGNPAREAFREGLDGAVAKANVEGEMIYPPDFLRDYVRSGANLENLYRSIAAGITGTAMPTWVDSMDLAGEKEGDPALVTPADLWAMAYYVRHLIEQRPAKLAEGTFALRNRSRQIHPEGGPLPAVVEEAGVPTEEAFEEEEFLEE
jgi:hypothetical protein